MGDGWRAVTKDAEEVPIRTPHQGSITMTHRLITRAALTAGAACLALTGIIGGAPAANAASTSTTTHDSFDPTGTVFACAGGNLTVTGGAISQIFHLSIDATGIGHISGNLVPHGVTLTDGSHDYVLSGAGSFMTKQAGPDAPPIVASDVQHFVIRRADGGGVFATVRVVRHVAPNGRTTSFDRGTCATPQE